MLTLKDFLKPVDAHTFIRLLDISGKILFNNKSVYEFTELYNQFNDLFVINCSAVNNCLHLILDIDKQI